jgi:Uma2 family endonuclease
MEQGTATTESQLPMTFDEFLSSADKHARSEWARGEMTSLAQTTERHDTLARILAELARAIAVGRRLGKVYCDGALMVVREEQAALLPDIAAVLNTNSIPVTDHRLDGPADLVIEVVSEASVARDYRGKRLDYVLAGVVEYWAGDARVGRTGVEALALNEEGYYEPIPPDADGSLSSEVVPGFRLDPAWLARDPLPDPAWAYERLVRHPGPPRKGLPPETRRRLVQEQRAEARRPRTSNPLNPPRWDEGMEPGRFPMTYTEYLDWSSDCMRCEWIDGMAYVRPFPGRPVHRA